MWFYEKLSTIFMYLISQLGNLYQKTKYRAYLTFYVKIQFMQLYLMVLYQWMRLLSSTSSKRAQESRSRESSKAPSLGNSTTGYFFFYPLLYGAWLSSIMCKRPLFRRCPLQNTFVYPYNTHAYSNLKVLHKCVCDNWIAAFTLMWKTKSMWRKSYAY